jgi:FkbM family methyltransferase
MIRHLVAAVVRRSPQWLLRAVGSRTGRYRLFARLDSIARASLSDAAVIPRGAAQGLRYNSGGGRAGFALGTWEPELQEVLPELLTADSVVWDVGAATGFHTLIMARAVGSEGRVVAFEPLPENLVLLRANISLNGFENVIVIEQALSDRARRGVLVPEGDDEVSIALAEPGYAEGGTEIDVTTADTLLLEGDVPAPSVIKIDVEGAEIELLQGAREILKRHKPVLVVEVHGRWDEFDPLLDDLGYDYVGVEHTQPRLADHATHVIARPRTG